MHQHVMLLTNHFVDLESVTNSGVTHHILSHWCSIIFYELFVLDFDFKIVSFFFFFVRDPLFNDLERFFPIAEKKCSHKKAFD